MAPSFKTKACNTRDHDEKADSSSIGSYRRLPGSSRRSVQKDNPLLDLYGRIYAGQFFGEKQELDANGDIKNEYSDKQGANRVCSVWAPKVESEINPGLKALAQYELQMYINDSEKTVSENSDNLRTRLAFAGVGANWGTVTFGRQKGAPRLPGGLD